MVCFGYATRDVRSCYAIVKQILINPDIEKVVLISHSQGGIITSMVIDWALQELPQDLVRKIEVYTFGNAANHFNSPARSTTPDSYSSISQSFDSSSGNAPSSGSIDPPGNLHMPASRTHNDEPLENIEDRAIYYIEHYAHTTDYVSLISVLHFKTLKHPQGHIPNYIGRVFARTSEETSGHQFVQHYLDGMFPIEKTESGQYTAIEESEFMNSDLYIVEGLEVPKGSLGPINDVDPYEGKLDAPWIAESCQDARLTTYNSSEQGRVVKVKDMSRLWRYLNGRTPPQ
ncbi:hypothetical protein Cpir12675_004346 [Ceratocystis pirilliformis]|uniref:Uncharacterized protein n=1 Tax=Ceratocystis pirilliformis TaxID=259994 RepID=A0ABR3YX66_9PEZI